MLSSREINITFLHMSNIINCKTYNVCKSTVYVLIFGLEIMKINF